MSADPHPDDHCTNCGHADAHAITCPQAEPSPLPQRIAALPRYEAKDVAKERAGGKPASPLVGIWREANSGVDPVVRWSDLAAVLTERQEPQETPDGTVRGEVSGVDGQTESAAGTGSEVLARLGRQQADPLRVPPLPEVGDEARCEEVGHAAYGSRRVEGAAMTDPAPTPDPPLTRSSERQK